MHTEPIVIDRVAGPVVVDVSVWKNTVLVAGIPQQGRRGVVQLPAVGGGWLRAKLKQANLFDPYPVIEVDGVKHRTGPETPYPLRLLGLLPFLLIIGGALLGGLIALPCIAANRAIARSDRSTAAKAFLMILVLAAGVLGYLCAAGIYWYAAGQPE
ncbi:hypothetical protein [Micromonospora chersina]|uniref:hypothetical protein n=1 Tax=Micromonospora chersina TaxID=47854 RepID=UPI00339E1F80